MSDDELDVLEGFLQVSDPQINAWLLEAAPCADERFSRLIAEIREFHAIGEAGSAQAG